MGDSGPVDTKALALAPGESQSISLTAEIGAMVPVSTLVESDIELAGKRHMTRGGGGYGSSLERGLRQASTAWYFAESALAPVT
ncbi:MAG TPA: hypothetical protein VM493_08735 [Vicinamibacterales bacterium]|nr:hypothetical protein [Vicinamibacterales bacterium]